MVCIAAFIILAVLALAVPLIRLFSRRLADQIMTLFRRSTHWFTRRITVRACETTFAEDVKGTVLRRVVLRHPNWVKPLSALMELLSVLIVLVGTGRGEVAGLALRLRYLQSDDTELLLA